MIRKKKLTERQIKLDKDIDKCMRRLYRLFNDRWLISKGLKVDENNYVCFGIQPIKPHCTKCGQQIWKKT